MGKALVVVNDLQFTILAQLVLSMVGSIEPNIPLARTEGQQILDLFDAALASSA
jgi:hypothetical protein